MDSAIQFDGAQVRSRDGVERLVNDNIHLAYYLGIKVGTPRGLSSSDAREAGFLGLARAAEDWDPSRGALSTYAFGWVRHEVSRIRRGEARALGHLTDDGEVPELEAPSDDVPDVAIVAAERVRVLAACVKRLSPIGRRIVRAILAEQPAASLGMAPRVYAPAKSKALAKLRAALEKRESAWAVPEKAPPTPDEKEATRLATNAAVRARRLAKQEALGLPVRPRGRPRRAPAEARA
jgi:DNA-directed RNA polymerase specialized sigma24 family protein